jgi:hypothetical protein
LDIIFIFFGINGKPSAEHFHTGRGLTIQGLTPTTTTPNAQLKPKIVIRFGRLLFFDLDIVLGRSDQYYAIYAQNWETGCCFRHVAKCSNYCENSDSFSNLAILTGKAIYIIKKTSFMNLFLPTLTNDCSESAGHCN